MGLGHINKASEGTMLLYSCDDTDGAVADISAGAGADVYSFTNANLSGSPTPANVAGLIGGARSFSGTGRWLKSGVGTQDFKSTNTFEAWIKHDGTNTGTRYFLTLGATAFITRLGMALVGGIQKFRYVYHATSGNVTCDSVSGVPADEWTHVAVTRRQSGIDVDMYINGVLDVAYTGLAAVSANISAQILCFGGTDSTAGPWAAQVDDLAMSTTVRTPAAILETYRRGKGILASKSMGLGTSFNWDFNRGFGQGRMKK